MIDELDALSARDLRQRGSLKWTRFAGDTIGAFVAEMDFGAAPAVTEALHAAVAAARFGYLPPWLADQVAHACAGWQLRYGWEVAPELVQPVSDGLTGLAAMIHFFSRPGSPVVLPTPAYMPFLALPPAYDRGVIEVPMAREGDRYVLDLDGLDRAFRDGGQLLVLCNPHNPVGRVHTAAELRALAEVVDRHGGRVFADEIHAPLVYPGHRHVPYASVSPAAAAHTVTLTSASKAWNLAGLRCAQLVFTDPADLTTWHRLGPPACYAASTLGAVATVAAYREGEPWLREVLGYLDRNRRALADLLPPPVEYVAPEGTYLAWLDCRGVGGEPTGGGRLGELLRERAGLAVVDGMECGGAGEGFVRLNFATPLPVLRDAVGRMTQALGLGD